MVNKDFKHLQFAMAIHFDTTAKDLFQFFEESSFLYLDNIDNNDAHHPVVMALVIDFLSRITHVFQQIDQFSKDTLKNVPEAHRILLQNLMRPLCTFLNRKFRELPSFLNEKRVLFFTNRSIFL